MKLRHAAGFWATTLSLGMLCLVIWSGCGSDTGGDPPPPAACAISSLHTDGISSWDTGELVKIHWVETGEPATVRVELIQGGAMVATLAAAAPNNGYFPWVVDLAGLDNGSDYGLRVTGTGDTSAACTAEMTDLTFVDVSNCTVAFTAPADTSYADDEFTITWDGYHTGGTVDVELWTASGSSLVDLVAVIAYDVPDIGTYTWDVHSFNNGTYENYRYVIRSSRSDLDCFAVSPPMLIVDEDICMITVRGTGPDYSAFEIGDKIDIELVLASRGAFVKLRLYTGNVFVEGGVIANGVFADEGFQWTVADFNHDGTIDRYRIKAINEADDYCVGVSNYFTINR